MVVVIQYIKSIASEAAKKVPKGSLLDDLTKIAEKGLDAAIGDYRQSKTIEYIKSATGEA